MGDRITELPHELAEAPANNDLLAIVDVSEAGTGETKKIQYSNILAGVPAPADASLIAKGIVELATIAETSAGTDETRAVTPDGLSQSVYGEAACDMPICGAATVLTVGDDKEGIVIPAKLAGFNVVKVVGNLRTKSSSGDITLQLSRGRRPDATTDYTWVDVCSTRPVIQANEYSSLTGTEALIDTSNDDLQEGDMLRPDVDGAGTGAKGASMQLSFRKP